MLLMDRYRGCLLGLAAGDAIGAQVEFSPPGTFPPITDIVGGGPHRLKPGEWTDDTIMALCLAESLIECKGFDPADQMRRYVLWMDEGYLSPKGYCFDIGGTTSDALRRFKQTGNPYSGATYEHSAANGSLMRLAPAPLFYARDPRAAIQWAGMSSVTTHALPICVDACRYLAALILGALNDMPKEDLLSDGYAPAAGIWEEEPLHPSIAGIASGSFKHKNPPSIRGTGYVVDCLEAALWAFYHGNDFRECILLAVSLGDDADTTGAVCGQLSGAFYGASGIPMEWREKLYRRELVASIADRLLALSLS